MTIVGGIRNISIDESKMDDQFQWMHNIKSDKRRTVHHELVGSSKEFLTKSVQGRTYRVPGEMGSNKTLFST